MKREYGLCVCSCFAWLTLPSWERSHKAVRELSHLVPNFKTKLDKASPEELENFYAEVSTIVLVIGSHLLNQLQLQRGANGAWSDDLNRIRGCIADWLNEANPQPSPLLVTKCRNNRGLAHDTTGRLLCPAEFDWDDPV